MRRLIRVVVAAVVLLVIGAGAFYWFELRGDSKPRAKILATHVTGGGLLDGTWKVIPGVGTGDAATSWVGYRVDEHLLFSVTTNTIVGRSTGVEGSLIVTGTKVSDVSVKVDMTRLTSNRSLRDQSLKSNGIETDTFPRATFVLTDPIQLPAGPKAGAVVHADARGDFTLHGVTRRVTIPIEGRWDGRNVQVIGKLPILIADYHMTIPVVPGIVSAADHGDMELQLFFARKS